MSNDNKKNAQQPIVLFKCPKLISDAKVSVQPGTPTWEVGIPRSPIKYEKKNRQRKRILGQIDDFPLRLPKILSLNSRVWDNLNEPLSRRK